MPEVRTASDIFDENHILDLFGRVRIKVKGRLDRRRGNTRRNLFLEKSSQFPEVSLVDIHHLLIYPLRIISLETEIQEVKPADIFRDRLRSVTLFVYIGHVLLIGKTDLILIHFGSVHDDARDRE